MRYLLDTIPFPFASTSGEKLSPKVAGMVGNYGDLREIIVVSLTEIAIKGAIGRLRYGKADVTTGIVDLRLHVLPFSVDHALELCELPLHRSDLFDRQIIAQALSEDIPIASCDEKFRLYKGLRVNW